MKPIYLILSMCLLVVVGAQATTTLHCPPDQTLSCTAQSYNLMAYGDAYIMKDGKRYSAGLANVTNNINSACHTGTIVRKWQTVDDNGLLIQCTQTLTFQSGQFGLANITWPETELQLMGCEADLDPSALPLEYQQPTYYFGLCNNVGQSYKDTEYVFGSDCKKIVREWTLLDWCSYNPATGAGQFKYYQVFKISNSSDPVLECPLKTTIIAKECNQSYVNLPLVTAVGKSCTGGYVIRNTSIYADTTSADASGIYPLGEHRIAYEVSYACGKTNYCETVVTVVEPAPVPYCLATLNVVLMGIDTDFDGAIDDGMVDVWAKDVDVNSYHPCHNKPLTFSFEADSVVMSRTFTCQEVGRNNVNMYVTDPSGKQSFCRVHIDVQNNGANIPDCRPEEGSRPLIAGRVSGPSGLAIAGVTVAHIDKQPMEEMTDQGMNKWHNVSYQRTSADGSYDSSEIPMYRGYEVSAYGPGDVTQMDESDVAILEAYIKGEMTFKNRYTYLAADLNEDGIVDVEDFHLMKNLLGMEEEEWPEQRQWVFYTKQSLMNQDTQGKPTMPQHLTKEIKIGNLDWGYGEDLDFVGILKGDLDYYENLVID